MKKWESRTRAAKEMRGKRRIEQGYCCVEVGIFSFPKKKYWTWRLGKCDRRLLAVDRK